MLAILGRWANRLVEYAAILLLLAMLTSVFLGVVFRGLLQMVLDAPFQSWTDEMAQNLLVWVGCVGWIIAGARGSHIRVTAILDRIRGPARVAMEVVIQAAVMILGLVMLFKSPILIQRNLDVEWVSLPLSVALVYMPVPIAGAAVVLQAAIEIVRVLTGGKPQSGTANL